MLGRGAAGDPALFRRLRGGAPASRDELRALHDALYAAYRADYGGVNGMRRMKELWNGLFALFDGGEDVKKRMMRTKDTAVFEACVAEAFDTLRLKDE